MILARMAGFQRGLLADGGRQTEDSVDGLDPRNLRAATNAAWTFIKDDVVYCPARVCFARSARLSFSIWAVNSASLAKPMK